MTATIPERIREKFLEEVLDLYSKGELSAGRAAEMLGISRAEFYEVLNQRKIPMPKKLNESILKELKKLTR
jgi:predicted HTH domain antitoxin